MTSLLTFSTRREALALAQVFMQDNPGGSWDIARLHDGRYRLDLRDPPPHHHTTTSHEQSF